MQMWLQSGSGALVSSLTLLGCGRALCIETQGDMVPPNMVLIVADDLGYADISCYGSTRVQTPHLDRLADEGMLFTDFHSNGPMCSPTRAALLTGRYQQRVGIDKALNHNEPGLPRGSQTIATALKSAGYATAIFGKWHLGDLPENNPVDCGFDEFRGHTYGDSDYIAHINRSGEPDWWHNRDLCDEGGYNTSLITDHAVQFIEDNKSRPFFLYVAHSAIHFPWMTPDDAAHRQEGTDYSKWTPDAPLSQSKLGPHADVTQVVERMIKELDASVGRIMDELRRCGLDQNTLVFFTSDNGGYVNYRGTHAGEISSNGPFRGQKEDMYEGGHRVPAIAWNPGRIPAGEKRSQALITMDLFPTILSFAGLSRISDHPSFDGIDFLPLLTGEDQLIDRTLFWKMGDECAARRGAFKLIIKGDLPLELYDLQSDPGEISNLYGSNSEIAMDLQQQLNLWVQDVGVRK